MITDDGYFTVITWRYTVIRESTMLDWIQDWESGKTSIDGTSIITPKLFVGKKEPDGAYVGALTGVYIGPDNVAG